MTKPNPLRVAIVGASGIGKNHAGWFHKHGCEICGFVGTNEQSINTTSEVLAARLGYQPEGYTDLKLLLNEQQPNIVCIASPPVNHFEHVHACMDAGVKILCEKPLVYNPQLASHVIVEQAQQLAGEATQRGVLLGTQMQYATIAGQLCALAGIPAEEVQTYTMEMETKNAKTVRSHETIWIELAPHPLSVLQKIGGASDIDTDSIRCEVATLETTAKFRLQRLDGNTIESKITTRCNPEASTPRRRFVINGVAIDVAGRKNESNEFVTYVSCGDEEFELPDLVDTLIGNFLAATRGEEKLLVTGEDGARNVEWMLQILDHSTRVQ